MAKKSKTIEYGDDSIESLQGADRVRKKPEVFLGTSGLEGCEHAFFEILSNSLDEAREGYGNVIRITIWKDKSVEVEDDGRGVPMGWNEKQGRYNWDLIYCELYASGKYQNNSDNSAYQYSLGTNGLGACATQCSSEYMDVYSYSGGKVSSMHFKKGNPVGELTVKDIPRSSAKKHGTVIRWRSDLEVFKSIDMPKEFFVETLKRQAVVNAGVRFILKYENEDDSVFEQEFYYETGIEERVRELSLGKAITEPKTVRRETKGRDRADLPEYKLLIEASFCFTDATVSATEYYHNSSWLEYGGSPEDAAKSAFLSAIHKFLKDTNRYKKTDNKINFSDIEECLVLVTSSFSTTTSYENQTKKKIDNEFIKQAMTEMFKSELESYFTEYPMDADRIADRILANRTIRESAMAARDMTKKKLTGNTDVANRVEKFISCRSKDPNVRELYIVEGDSAATSCKLGRSAEFQAIMPVRGKTLNCQKSSYEKIMKSEIITDLLKVIGCGVEIKHKDKNLSLFSPDQLKWNRIVICTDADEDGYQIRALLLTLFYRLLPTLLKMGKIYIAESPLFEINTKSDTYFAYDERERIAIVKQLEESGQKYTIQRSKGLGENEPEMMWQTTMNPATRRLIRVCEADAAETAKILDMLLGDNLEARKKYIAENGYKYMAEVDV
ncbi:MAG: toprim domain-containing protein [Eubacteriales bacterium]